MTPEEFTLKWGIKRSQLCLLLGKSQVTVDHWFSDRQPPEDVKSRLNEIDTLFECWKLQDERIPHLRQIYESLQN